MYKKGDIVFHDYLGKGKVIENLNHLVNGFYRVLFHETPPKRYNMGKNPCCVFEKDLKGTTQ